MNPYSAMFDRADDVAEHARELAADMAVPYHADPPRIDRMANAKRKSKGVYVATAAGVAAWAAAPHDIRVAVEASLPAVAA